METWNQLHQPGWRQILANWSLEIETPGANSVTFKPLEEQCNQTVGIRIEVACNGSDGESTQSFELLEMFTLTNLSSSTSYQCKARLVKEDGESRMVSAGTKKTNITTLDSETPDKLLGQIIPQNMKGEKDETRSPTTAATVTAAEIKAGDSTTPLIVVGLSVYSVVVALAIVIVYNCRGEVKKPPKRVRSDENDTNAILLLKGCVAFVPLAPFNHHHYCHHCQENDHIFLISFIMPWPQKI